MSTGSTDFLTTNDLHEYDPGTNTFSPFVTSGAIPTPRDSFAIAILDDRVFLHGGRDASGCSPKDHFVVLDMRTRVWTKIDSGFSTDLWGHTLSPISSSQLLLVGGTNGPSRLFQSQLLHVMIFDADVNQWKNGESSPVEFCGNQEGLYHHRTVEIANKNGLIVICMGGKVSSGKYHDHIFMLDFVY